MTKSQTRHETAKSRRGKTTARHMLPKFLNSFSIQTLREKIFREFTIIESECSQYFIYITCTFERCIESLNCQLPIYEYPNSI